LFIGSRADNHADMVAKGRQARGDGKLSSDDVTMIRELHRAGRRQAWLATAFGVSQPSISNVVNRRTWAHVT